MVDLSIVVPVYNHAPYIEQAINSILMQKVNFSYEVLIGEDCSTDNSREILKGIEKRLPSQFEIFYREHNMGGNGDGNFNDLYSRMKGRYFIVLEGDDFWTYEYKLQKEYDFLETHPSYIAVAHDTNVVDENGRDIPWSYPCCRKREYTIKDFRKGLLAGQTTTIMVRNFMTYKLFDYKLLPSNYPGDRKKAFLYVANGRVACLPYKWSSYRLVTTHGSSYSATSRQKPFDYRGTLDYFYSLYDYAIKHDVDKNVKMVSEQLYFRVLFHVVRKKESRTILNINFKTFWNTFLSLQFPVRSTAFLLLQIIKWPYRKIQEHIESDRYNKATGLE
nr:glycosyltransferase family 2 protein [uncultured Mitsuokella sp.]